MKTLVVVLFLVIMFNGFVAWAEEQEALLGLTVDEGGISFQVFSGGCTHKEDFQVQFLGNTRNNALNLVRMRPDFCKALVPYGTTIKFTYEELGLKKGAEFKVVNPLAAVRVY